MNNDLISKSELKAEILKALDKGNLTDYEPSAVICEIYDRCIDNAPTVETYTQDDVQYAIREGHQVGYEMAKAKFERPKGEWIEVNQIISDTETSTHWECSICKEPDRKEGKSKFCCECGADMRGGRQ